jgi:hypothetical protein
MQTFYISRDGSAKGPFTENELRSKIQAGEISRSDHAWTDGLTKWLPLSELLLDIESVRPVSTKSQFRDRPLPKGFSPKHRWIYKVVGAIGELEVYDDKVTITNTGVMGFLNRGLKGTKTIPLHSISAIQFKRGGITRGYLQFTIPGGNESKGGVFDAVADENTFLFDEESNTEVESIRNYIESRMKEIRTPQSATLAAGSLGDELTKLAALKTQGLLSDEEFQTAKKRLLG